MIADRSELISAAQRFSPGSSSDDEAQDLVESFATEIRRLYSLTADDGYWTTESYTTSDAGDLGAKRKQYGSYWDFDTITETREVFVKTGERSAPDVAGIQSLIALIPSALREKVRLLSGNARQLF